MIIRHPDFATMQVRSERIRDFAEQAGCDVTKHEDSGETTPVTHYIDGRIEVQCDGDAEALASEIDNAGAWPIGIEVLDEHPDDQS